MKKKMKQEEEQNMKVKMEIVAYKEKKMIV